MKITVKDAAKDYCKKIFNDNTRISEMVLIGSLVNGGFNENSDIDIVCVYEPDFDCPLEDGSAEMSRLLSSYGYTLEGYPVDIGFITDSGDIFLGGGLISRYRGNSEVIFSRADEKQ